MTEEFKKLPASVAFQRGFIISDGVFYDQNRAPINVYKHTTIGVQAPSKKGSSDNNNASNTDTGDVVLPSPGDIAKMNGKSTECVVEFSFKFVNLKHTFYKSFNESGKGDDLASEYRSAILKFIEDSKSSDALRDIANRYARNILNGRWLWKNRIYASAINVQIWSSGSDSKLIIDEKNSIDISLNDFDNFNDNELMLGELLLQQLLGEANDSFIIVGKIDFGLTGSIEVFPSQNFVSGDKSLYCVNRKGYLKTDNDNPYVLKGQAALRDVKISNALRTIDTWYPDYSDTNNPISVEINGANLQYTKIYRPSNRSHGVDGISILKKIRGLDIESNDSKFLMALFIRGCMLSKEK